MYKIKMSSPQKRWSPTKMIEFQGPKDIQCPQMQKYHFMLEAVNGVLRAYTVDSDLGFKPCLSHLPVTRPWAQK